MWSNRRYRIGFIAGTLSQRRIYRRAYLQGMKHAQDICATLAKTELADGDAFDAALTCEASIRRVRLQVQASEPPHKRPDWQTWCAVAMIVLGGIAQAVTFDAVSWPACMFIVTGAAWLYVRS